MFMLLSRSKFNIYGKVSLIIAENTNVLGPLVVVLY